MRPGMNGAQAFPTTLFSHRPAEAENTLRGAEGHWSHAEAAAEWRLERTAALWGR